MLVFWLFYFHLSLEQFTELLLHIIAAKTEAFFILWNEFSVPLI